MPLNPPKIGMDLRALQAGTPKGLEDVEDAQDREAAAHMAVLSITGYLSTVETDVGKALRRAGVAVTARAMIESLVRRMAPQDAMEEILVVQALLTNVRVLLLTALSAKQTDLQAMRAFNDYAEKACNTYRRQMLALAEYRRPSRAGDSFTAIKLANIANQQVVQNGNARTKNTTNKQGCEQTALPAQPGGLGLAEILGQNEPAVGAQHRSKDG